MINNWRAASGAKSIYRRNERIARAIATLQLHTDAGATSRRHALYVDWPPSKLVFGGCGGCAGNGGKPAQCDGLFRERQTVGARAVVYGELLPGALFHMAAG